MGFKGSNIRNQFKKLKFDLEQSNKVYNLTTILSDKEFLVGCYQNIRFKPGNMTHSLDGKTLDGINEHWFDETCNSFKNGSFQFRPFKRTYISKSNGKSRPLIMPSLRDKIVQEGMRVLLNKVFEKNFKKSSHAFLNGGGFHTALNHIRLNYGKVNWFIEGNIEQQYPSIDHKFLVKILRDKIQDE